MDNEAGKINYESGDNSTLVKAGTWGNFDVIYKLSGGV